MEKKYLPYLKSLRIKDYSLYPGELDFSYEFIDGVNLIIGGNGVGKTTFLNILKYALIGLYKKGIDVKRREVRGKEYRYERRVNLPYNFFSNRMSPLAAYNESAEVSLTFTLNKTVFQITRSLANPAIKSVFVTEGGKSRKLNGHVTSQSEFDTMFSDKDKNEERLMLTLQGQYEDLVGKASNHDVFDNLIFIVNDVLFFSETRKTIMWDGATQSKLSSKYFIDPQLDEEKEKAELEGKYKDSLGRHKSEDIRAIRKIIEAISSTDDQNKDFKTLVEEITNSKKAVDSSYRELERKQKERETTEVKISKLYSAKNSINFKIEDLERQKRDEETIVFKDAFQKVTPKYQDYLRFLKSSGDCPLCNNTLQVSTFTKLSTDEAHCMMCNNDLIHTRPTSKKLTGLKQKIIDEQSNLRNSEKEIVSTEDMLTKLDAEFKGLSSLLNNEQSRLRKSEFALQQLQNSSSSTTASEYKAMSARINELDIEKDAAFADSKSAYQKAAEISTKIDYQRLESREELSGMFNNYGSKFLGVPCELVYEDPKDGYGKRYLPRIGGIDRLHEEELSESQRFFIDQSFRLSVLNFFNASSSFFMCETPDSSLDISYEKNAAKIFIEYLRKPNQLILTSNLNNSEFLEYLIREAKAINYINLLKIGRQSAIQSNSVELTKASAKIEKMIHAKQ